MPPVDDTNQLIEQRRANLAALAEAGIDPFANKFTPSETCDAAKANYEEERPVAVAGRLVSKREMGKTGQKPLRASQVQSQTMPKRANAS